MGQPPLCIDCDKEIPFERYRLGVCPECMEERAMKDLRDTIEARKQGKATAQDQVEAAAKALRRYERDQHRPGNFIFLALALGLVAGYLAAACSNAMEEYLNNLSSSSGQQP